MVLTEQGRDVLKHAMRISSELEKIRASASDVEAPLTGQVAIRLPPTVADIISVPLVAAFGKGHPNAVLRLVSAYTGYLMDWLHRGEIDLAVLYDPRAARSLRSRPLLLENLFLIGPPEAAFSTVRAVSFRTWQANGCCCPAPDMGCERSLSVARQMRR
jgi:LysR family transcriptional regulator, nitrogen assimilation regulatory protein